MSSRSPLVVVDRPWADPLVLFAAHAERPGAQLLHSVPGAPGGGRFTYLLLEPFESLSAKGGTVCIDGKEFGADPFAVLRERLASYALEPDPALPSFQGGAAGCFGYELGALLEPLRVGVADPYRFPDLDVGFYDVVTVFDWQERRARIVSTGRPLRDRPKAEDRAAARAAEIGLLLDNNNKHVVATEGNFLDTPRSTLTREAYEAAVKRAIDYIFAGDIYQANLSQRFETALPPGFAAFALFERLCDISPVSFAAYQNLPGLTLVSNSPERFLRFSDPRGARRVETRPIKGTARRGHTAAADAEQARTLTESDKDRAENVMIVDLLRNDLSKVCENHTVEVAALCEVESYAGVHHLVSTVAGRLRRDRDAVDLFTAAFPGGSITGAPKPRAMEIIAELEGLARGPYCGALGYFGFDGSMDTSVAIRTVCIEPGPRDARRGAYFQVGGGIVADSNAAAEYDESLAKAEAFLAAVSCGAARGEAGP